MRYGAIYSSGSLSAINSIATLFSLPCCLLSQILHFTTTYPQLFFYAVSTLKTWSHFQATILAISPISVAMLLLFSLFRQRFWPFLLFPFPRFSYSLISGNDSGHFFYFRSHASLILSFPATILVISSISVATLLLFSHFRQRLWPFHPFPLPRFSYSLISGNDSGHFFHFRCHASLILSFPATILAISSVSVATLLLFSHFRQQF